MKARGTSAWPLSQQRLMALNSVMNGGLGCAGAVTAGACVLCAAGTYQTGSGPKETRREAAYDPGPVTEKAANTYSETVSQS